MGDESAANGNSQPDVFISSLIRLPRSPFDVWVTTRGTSFAPRPSRDTIYSHVGFGNLLGTLSATALWGDTDTLSG
jgi:hypothetical protein